MTSTRREHEAVAATEDVESKAPSLWWRLLHRWHYSFVGVVGALAALCLSLTPSLLPRGHVLQGLISGISAAIGYGLGVLAVWLVRQLSTRPLPIARPAAWRWLAVVAVVALAAFWWLGSGWQSEVHRLMGLQPPARLGSPAVLLLAARVGAGLVVSIL